MSTSRTPFRDITNLPVTPATPASVHTPKATINAGSLPLNDARTIHDLCWRLCNDVAMYPDGKMFKSLLDPSKQSTLRNQLLFLAGSLRLGNGATVRSPLDILQQAWPSHLCLQQHVSPVVFCVPFSKLFAGIVSLLPSASGKALFVYSAQLTTEITIVFSLLQVLPGLIQLAQLLRVPPQQDIMSLLQNLFTASQASVHQLVLVFWLSFSGLMRS